MDNSDDQHLQPEPTKPSRFLGCFGFSSRKKPVVLEKSRSNKKRKQTFISLPAKKSAIKTVPLDSANHAVSDRKVVDAIDLTVLSNSKMPHQLPVDEKAASGDQVSEHGPQEMASELEEKIITENRDSTNDQMKSPKGTNNTLQKQFCRKIDAVGAGQSQPGSPDANPEPNRPSSVSRLTSIPIPNHQKPVGNKSSDKLKKTHNKKRRINGNKYESIVGMSIIMVTLLIMLFWGRLCAILCMSAWFYFISQFGSGFNQNVDVTHGPVSGESDFGSEEYKKRVVLEEFLERNHRSVM